MLKVYQVEIEEVLQKVVKIEANSLKKAINIAKEKYKNEEYVLSENDFIGVKFNEYNDEIKKHKNKRTIER